MDANHSILKRKKKTRKRKKKQQKNREMFLTKLSFVD